ncbi:MAG: hypothetical protein HY344_04530 [Candidatus Levybacteria bacterium]|nr:hypothetical protein [Candidatus Levybacteria bacterium]
MLATSEGSRRFNGIRKVVEDTVGISAFNWRRNDAKSKGDGNGIAVASGIENAAYQVAVPLYFREIIDSYNKQEEARWGLAMFYGLIDIGAMGAAIAFALNAGIESGIGVKAAYNVAASAIPEVTSSVSGKIRSLRSSRS